MKFYQIDTIARLAKLGLTAYQIDRLGHLARRLNSLDCAYCNGTIDSDKHDQREATIMERAAASVAGARPRLTVYHQGDCRGVSLYVGPRGMNHQNYTSVGVAVNF